MKIERKGTFKLFGRFLLDRERITEEDIYFARALQRKKNKKIGEVAADMGLMTAEEVEMVLTQQEDDGGSLFGELAVQMGILSEDDLVRILKEQEESHLYFGEALVENGALTNPELIEELKAYNREKLMYLKKMKVE